MLATRQSVFWATSSCSAENVLDSKGPLRPRGLTAIDWWPQTFKDESKTSYLEMMRNEF